MCCPDGATPEKSFGRNPKSCRLTRASEFASVRQKGESITGRYFILGYLQTAEPMPARVGIITTKRLGNAVVRNRVRRRLREVTRVNRSRLGTGLWLVLVARKAVIDATFAQIQQEWMRLGNRCTIFAS